MSSFILNFLFLIIFIIIKMSNKLLFDIFKVRWYKICFIGDRSELVGKFSIGVPDDILQMDEYPEHLYCENEEDLGDWIADDEWTELSNMVKKGKRVSGLVSLDETDIVFGIDEKDYDQMKQVMFDAWNNPEFYDDPKYGLEIMKNLDTMEWNDELKSVIKM